jgi:Cu-processing system permease protein
VVFTAFALVIAYFGAAQQGAVGLRGIDVTIASLVSLVIYLVPLIALMLGYDAVVAERERGSLDLLLSLPITRFELLIGKFAGLACALGVATFAGFGLAGVLLFHQLGAGALYHFGGFMVSAFLLGLCFLSLAVMVSVLAHDRVRASGAAIALWFFYVLVYDLLLLGILVVTEGRFSLNFFPALLMLNPADIFRILNIFGFDDVRRLYGLATVFPETLANPWLLGAAMVFWIVTPLGLATWRFK